MLFNLELDDTTMLVIGAGCAFLAGMCIPDISQGVLETRAYKTRRDIARPARDTAEWVWLRSQAQANLKKGLGWFCPLWLIAVICIPIVGLITLLALGGAILYLMRQQNRSFAPRAIVRPELHDDNIHRHYPKRRD